MRALSEVGRKCNNHRFEYAKWICSAECHELHLTIDELLMKNGGERIRNVLI